jgi:type I restriction enzyme, R subunit
LFGLERSPSVISRRTPATCLIKLRQYGETLAQLVAAKAGLFRDTQEPQADLLRRLKFDRVITPQVGEFFHYLRTLGNKATHENDGTHAEALTALKFARELGIWFHRTFGGEKSFRPSAFVPPSDPTAATLALTAELARLTAELDQHRTTAEKALAAAEEKERARLSAEERARKDREDRALWEQLAAERLSVATAIG